jgi:nucleotide-binding universal stress UspA family protein
VTAAASMHALRIPSLERVASTGRGVAVAGCMAFTKILCPVDFSPGSQQALRTAVRIANEHDAELVLVHSWYIPPLAFAGEYAYAGNIVHTITEDARRGLDAAAAEARTLGARRVASRMLHGLPWQQIVEAAQRETGLDLIVLGTHGRTGLPRVVMGSVAELVVRHAPCPVLTVRPGNEPAPYQHVLCPVDLSKSAREAMKLAAELVTPGGAGITVLHVLELPVAYAGELTIPDFHRDLDARSAAVLDRWTADLKTAATVPIAQVTRVGRPGAQILAALEDDRTFDLVVMGSRGHTGVERMLLGSVAEKVVRHARCPVLVAPGTRSAS